MNTVVLYLGQIEARIVVAVPGYSHHKLLWINLQIYVVVIS